MHCPNCGNQMAEGERLCARCGAEAPAQASGAAPRHAAPQPLAPVPSRKGPGRGAIAGIALAVLALAAACLFVLGGRGGELVPSASAPTEVSDEAREAADDHLRQEYDVTLRFDAPAWEEGSARVRTLVLGHTTAGDEVIRTLYVRPGDVRLDLVPGEYEISVDSPTLLADGSVLGQPDGSLVVTVGPGLADDYDALVDELAQAVDAGEDLPGYDVEVEQAMELAVLGAREVDLGTIDRAVEAAQHDPEGLSEEEVTSLAALARGTYGLVAPDDGREPGEELVEPAEQFLAYWCANYLDSGVGEPTAITEQEWTEALRPLVAEGTELAGQVERPDLVMDWVAAEMVSYQEVLELGPGYVMVRVTIAGTQSSWSNALRYTEDWWVSFDDDGKIVAVDLTGADYSI